MHFVRVLPVLMICFALGACNQAQQKEVKENAGKAGDKTKEAFATFKEQMNKSLKQADEKIQQLEAKAKDASGGAKVQLDKQIAELKDKHSQTREKLKKLGESSADAWHELKGGMQDAAADLSKSVDSAWQKFNKKE